MLTLQKSQKLIAQALQIAERQTAQIAVAICDSHGELICFSRMDNCSLQAAVLAKNKAYTSARDRQPSGDLGAWAKETGKDMGYWSDPKFTGIMGGLPIYIADQLVGAIGVSGLNEQEDQALAAKALEILVQ
ncbi:GlcG/HbpS family heme-binding protein [Psychromonas antarctica]|jgi:glc operon protein GlcG|uniref:GlcG/HbpS family heme-binding protein n=1 Tax=Psychromonas antarctica TaxID=67573 RepID=UPI001EE9237F|nr:heme-binding protein [Psychromonas antarctica]MCG6201466.1 heme-binding protein [Psychromonas antarctica]